VLFVDTLKICVISKGHSVFLIVASAAPLAFEIVAAGAAYWNAVDRPRQANQPLQHELAKDGFKFFLVRGSLQTPACGFNLNSYP
jgi:hypothetical protein